MTCLQARSSEQHRRTDGSACSSLRRGGRAVCRRDKNSAQGGRAASSVGDRAVSAAATLPTLGGGYSGRRLFQAEWRGRMCRNNARDDTTIRLRFVSDHTHMVGHAQYTSIWGRDPRAEKRKTHGQRRGRQGGRGELNSMREGGGGGSSPGRKKQPHVLSSVIDAGRPCVRTPLVIPRAGRRRRLRAQRAPRLRPRSRAPLAREGRR